MSLSNLESQLASLNSKSGLPSTKQHHESVGRGVHHSVKHGHAVLTSNAKHKPSVLHPDSRSAAAADVPLTTLRENSVTSLQYLMKHSSKIFDMNAVKLPWSTLFGSKSINFERGLNTLKTNKKFDGLIKDALFMLSTSWGDSTGSLDGPSITIGANIPSSVLHIMEYLVQKYFIHVYNSEALLVSFLPHHETILFERIIQLVDLSQNPHWSFLRPFSGSGGSVGIRGVPRTHIAKWAASTVDNGGGIVLINAICDVARRASKIHFQETTHFSPTTDYSTMVTRKGISLIISFSTVTLAEILHIQNSKAGTIAEPTIRCLLPYVLGAVEPRRNWKKDMNSKESKSWSLGAVCTEWRSFGYILISILMGNCDLSIDACEALAIGIVQGSAEVDGMLRLNKNVGDQFVGKSLSTESSLTAMESASDSLLALMSIVSSCNIEKGNTDEGGIILRSPLSFGLTTDCRMNCTFGSSNGTLGCGLSLSTYYMLTRLDILPSALGYLSTERDVDVRQLLATLIIFSVSVVGHGMSKINNRSCEFSLRLATHLIEESTLRTAWLAKDHALSISASVFLVKAFTQFVRLNDNSTSVKNFAKLLHCIRAIDPVGCDRGVGHAVTNISATNPKTRVIVANKVKMLLQLSGHLNVELCALKDASSKDSLSGSGYRNDDNSLTGTATALEHLLPSRVALEHPLEDIRIQAIEKLIQEIDGMSNEEKYDVAHSLFRRYTSDDTANVAASAANALRSTLLRGVISEDFYLQSSTREGAIIGIQKWSVASEVLIHHSTIRTTLHNHNHKNKKGKHGHGSSPPCQEVMADDVVSAACASIRISGLLAQKMTKQLLRDYQFDSLTPKEWSDIIPEDLYVLIQELALHSGIGVVNNHDGHDAGKIIRETALCSLEEAVGATHDATGKGTQTFWNNNVFLGIVSNCIRTISSTSPTHNSALDKSKEEITARKVFLNIFLNNSAMDPNHLCDHVMSIHCSAVLALLANFTRDTQRNDSFIQDASKLLECIKRCTLHYMKEGDTDKTMQLIIDLFSVPSPIAFDCVSIPTLEVISERDVGEGSAKKMLLLLLDTCARPSINTTAVVRILKYAEKGLFGTDIQPDKEIIQCGLIISLALLVHSELKVREAALSVLNRIESTTNKEGSLQVIGDLCSLICEPSSSFRANLLLDGASALPILLQRAVQASGNASILRKLLLESCVISVLAVKHFSLSIPYTFGIGFCNSSVLLLSAMESAGESTFPLTTRWDIAGKAIFDLFLQHCRESVPSTMQKLVECVVVMLKGITVKGNDTGKHVMITTGPLGFGRRHRSYSFGKSDSISYIESYPDSMIESIKDCLSSSLSAKKGQLVVELCESMNSLVLSRPSWSHGIFPKFDNGTKNTIATSLLKLRAESSMDSAGTAFSGLTIDALEVCALLNAIEHQSQHNAYKNPLALSLIADYVRSHAEPLAIDRNILDLSSCIFNQVSQLSKDENNRSEYTRSCLLHALCSIHDHNKTVDLKVTCPSKSHKKKYSKQVGEHARHIVSLLGAGDDGTVPLQSGKSRLICLTLLTHLCSTFPTTVVHCLLPTISNVMSTLNSATLSVDLQMTCKTKAAEETLMVIIPAYCKHASVAGLTLIHLLSTFLGNCDLGGKIDASIYLRLMAHLIDALLLSFKTADGGIAIASVVTYFVAQMSSNCMKSITISALTSNLLVQVDVSHQIVAALQIVQYAADMMSLIQKSPPPAKRFNKDHKGFLSISTQDISLLAARGGNSDTQKNSLVFNEVEKLSLMQLIKSLLEMVRCNILSAPVTKQAIRNCDNKQAEICLKIWQLLMEIQSYSSQLRHEAPIASKTLSVTSRELLDTFDYESSASIAILQRLLPVPHFLALVSSIINDDDADLDLQKKSISLLSERSAEIDAFSAEGALFLGIVPDLVKLINVRPEKNKKYDARRTAGLQEATCRTLDQLGRSLGLVTVKKIMQKRSTLFLPAIKKIALFLHHASLSSQDVLFSSIESSQTLSSTVLCLSTLITLLKARCLAELPKIVKSLISLLSFVNLRPLSTDLTMTSMNQSCKLLQLSLLRTLVAVVETLPQFMVSYLEPLITTSGLLCSSLRQYVTDDDLAVKSMAERLANTIAILSPSRQLIPILCKACNKCFTNKIEDRDNCNEGITVFSILKTALNESSRTDLGPVAGKIVNALIHAYGYDCNEQNKFKILEATNSTLVALVMKLSEAQLRQLYAKLRQWCLTSDTSNTSTLRKHSFYSLSAVMSKELRSIFLPCVSIGDIVTELEFAASCMCSISKETERNKRQKLNQSSMQYGQQEVKSLQPLLLFLETVLTVDAHEGGNWVRNNDNERFRMLVGPLGKLLQAHIPRDSFSSLDSDVLAVSKQASSYEVLVQGVGTKEHGNVISCITSLAAAAGDEQLWKPLNHSVLEACGNEGRAEVRKSGVKALLCIIQSLGEEYMVLLPECLPVLSELLEDDEDEEIVALAKECIRLGEVLLGESLEDSLK